MTTPHPLQQAFPSLMRVLVEKYQALPQWAAIETGYGEQADLPILLDILSKLHHLDEVKEFQNTFADRISSAWLKVEQQKIQDVVEEADDRDAIEAISAAVMEHLAMCPQPWAAVKDQPISFLENEITTVVNDLYGDEFQASVLSVSPIDEHNLSPVDITFRILPSLDDLPDTD